MHEEHFICRCEEEPCFGLISDSPKNKFATAGEAVEELEVMRDRVIKTVDEALVKSRAFELAGKCYAGIRQERLEAEF